MNGVFFAQCLLLVQVLAMAQISELNLETVFHHNSFGVSDFRPAGMTKLNDWMYFSDWNQDYCYGKVYRFNPDEPSQVEEFVFDDAGELLISPFRLNHHGSSLLIGEGVGGKFGTPCEGKAGLQFRRVDTTTRQTTLLVTGFGNIQGICVVADAAYVMDHNANAIYRLDLLTRTDGALVNSEKWFDIDQPISCDVVDHSDGTYTMYVGTLEDKIHKFNIADSSATTGTLIGSMSGFRQPYGMTILPEEPSIMYLSGATGGIGSGVLRKLDLSSLEETTFLLNQTVYLALEVLRTDKSALYLTDFWKNGNGALYKVGLPVDCTVSDWGEWGSCSKVCGNGTRTREREITIEPLNGGAECPHLNETEPCNTDPCRCKPVVLVGLDTTYRNKGRTQVQMDFATAQIKAIADTLGDAIHPDRGQVSIVAIGDDSTDEVVAFDTPEAKNHSFISKLMGDLTEQKEGTRDKETAFADFFQENVPKLLNAGGGELASNCDNTGENLIQNSLREAVLHKVFQVGTSHVSEETRRTNFILLVSDFLLKNRKETLQVYGAMDAALDVSCPPEIICYRTNTWTKSTKFEDKYCGNTLRFTQSEGHDKNRQTIASIIANYICPVTEVLRPTSTPCDSIRNKKACKKIRAMHDASDPPTGERGYKFCTWSNGRCVPRPRYQPLFQ